jgi:hypothetical protein
VTELHHKPSEGEARSAVKDLKASKRFYTAAVSENRKLSSSARKECESLAEGCMAFGLHDLAMRHNDAFEWPSKDIFY